MIDHVFLSIYIINMMNILQSQCLFSISFVSRAEPFISVRHFCSFEKSCYGIEPSVEVLQTKIKLPAIIVSEMHLLGSIYDTLRPQKSCRTVKDFWWDTVLQQKKKRIKKENIITIATISTKI